VTERPTDDVNPTTPQQAGAIPDFKWVNRHVPIREVCIALGLRFGCGNMLHCWHDDRHQNGDRTASVSIRKSTNRLRCFGCGSMTLSVLDLVMDALGTDVAGAARWLEQHFNVKHLAKGRHLKDSHAIRSYRVGFEDPIELLIKSGIWAMLKPGSQRIIPALLYLAKPGDVARTFVAQVSYRAIQRYSGVKSFGTISNALKQLAELGWLTTLPQANPEASVMRDVNTYILTPFSDAVMEMAKSVFASFRVDIEQERELRRRERNARRRNTQVTEGSPSSASGKEPNALLKSTSLYDKRSVGQNGATDNVAGNWSEALLPRRRAVISQRCVSTVRSHKHRQSQFGGGDSNDVPRSHKLGWRR
jgi:hypothetical protein